MASKFQDTLTKEKLEAIRERVDLPWSHEGSDPMPPLEQCVEDRAALLAEVDRLTEEIEGLEPEQQLANVDIDGY